MKNLFYLFLFVMCATTQLMSQNNETKTVKIHRNIVEDVAYDDGKENVKMKINNGDVSELIINDKLIPPSEYAQHQPLINMLKGKRIEKSIALTLDENDDMPPMNEQDMLILEDGDMPPPPGEMRNKKIQTEKKIIIIKDDEDGGKTFEKNIIEKKVQKKGDEREIEVIVIDNDKMPDRCSKSEDRYCSKCGQKLKHRRHRESD